MVDDVDPISDDAGTHDAPPVKGEDTRTVPFSALSAERRRVTEARRAAEAEAARAKALEEAHAKLTADAEMWRKSHEAWTAHQAAEAERATKALADRLAKLADDVREDIEAEIKSGMQPAQVLRWIERAEKMAASKAADTSAETKPTQPIGGRSAAGAPSADELSPEIAEWVRTVRPDLASVSAGVVRKMFERIGPKKK